MNRGGRDLGTVTTLKLPECRQPTLCRSQTYPRPICDLGGPPCPSAACLPPNQEEEEVLPAWLRGGEAGEMPRAAPDRSGDG